MIITNQTSVTIYVEVVSPYRSIEFELQTLEPGDTDEFKIDFYIRIYSEIGTCLGINFGTEITDVRNFGKLVLEECPKNSGISAKISEK